MKKNLLYISIIFLGISMIISAFILSRSKTEQIQSINGSLNGTFGITQSNYQVIDTYSGDIISLYTAAGILLYDNQDVLKQAIDNGNKNDIPYVSINGNYLFSKKALEEWIYNKSLSLE
ncbi:MAG: hypothetical protein K0R46_2756 [Herbinix sp.]|nr:hypothetical protein [Herbinix sp.]